MPTPLGIPVSFQRGHGDFLFSGFPNQGRQPDRVTVVGVLEGARQYYPAVSDFIFTGAPKSAMKSFASATGRA